MYNSVEFVDQSVALLARFVPAHPPLPVHAAMPIDTSDNYCDQLRSLVSQKLQALQDEYQPFGAQWNEAVETIDILLENLLVEVQALADVDRNFPEIRVASDGKSHPVRDEALKFLGRYDENTVSADVNLVRLYLKGRFEKARREVEEYTVSRDEAEEALWGAINGLHAELKMAQENLTDIENGLPQLMPPAALQDADSPEHPLDMAMFDQAVQADAVPPPTPSPKDNEVNAVPVGLANAENLSHDASQTP